MAFEVGLFLHNEFEEFEFCTELEIKVQIYWGVKFALHTIRSGPVSHQLVGTVGEIRECGSWKTALWCFEPTEKKTEFHHNLTTAKSRKHSLLGSFWTYLDFIGLKASLLLIFEEFRYAGASHFLK